ncbi:MAG: DsbA family protein [Hyphomonadaceae bacterium]
MIATRRRELLLGAAALALAGCGGGGGGGAAVNSDDMVLGADDAPVTLIEYASSTCPHCADFHEENWERLKETYIDTGKVRYVFREFPTPPPAVAVAGFQVARCGGASSEQYFARLGELFRQQQAMFASGSMEGIRAKLVEIGGAAGLSETQVMGCINDQAGAERIRRITEGAREFGVTGTPTFILNGDKVEDPSVVTWDGLSRLIEAELQGAS